MNAKQIRSLALTLCVVFGATAAANAQATAYFVATNGNDANAGTDTQPFRTLRRGVRALKPGATLYIKGGTYAEELFGYDIPSGISWDAPVTIAAVPGAQVILQPAVGSGNVISLTSSASRYIIFDGLVLDAVNTVFTSTSYGVGFYLQGASFIRIQNSEIKNAPGQGVHIAGGGSNQFVNVRVHDNGRVAQYTHGFYVASNDTLIERCEVYNNAAWGIQLYGESSPTRNVVRNNKVFSNGRLGHGVGIGVSGNQNAVYNNLIWGHNESNAIEVAYLTPTDTRIEQNTIFNNYGIYIHTDSTNARVRNNIVYGSNAVIDNQGRGSTVSNNLMADPRFTNAGARDFSLQSTSPAIDAGVAIAEVATDFANVPRPQGGKFDIGAYEYAAGSVVQPTVAPTTESVVQPTVAPTTDPVTEPAPTTAPAPTDSSSSGSDTSSSPKRSSPKPKGKPSAATIETTSLTTASAASDTTPPELRIKNIMRSGSTNSYRVSMHASDGGGVARIEVLVDSTRLAELTSPKSDNIVSVAIQGSGTHTVLVRAWDSAGNMASTSRPVTVQ